MANKYETSPEHKKFMYGTIAAYLTTMFVFVILRFEYPKAVSIGKGSPLFFTYFICLGIGTWIYRKRTANWPHFWAGILTFCIIAATFSGLFYLID